MNLPYLDGRRFVEDCFCLGKNEFSERLFVKIVLDITKYVNGCLLVTRNTI